MRTKKNFLLLAALMLTLSACAPVLSRSYMNTGEFRVSFAALRNDPEKYRGTLYVLGGVIVETRLIQDGTRVEVIHVPVDRYGYFQDRGRSEGRYLAVSPQVLDPEVYRRGRRITLAAEFVGLRKAMIDEMEYSYPVFEVRQIHLWPREQLYYPAYYYYEPWFYPYPYYYRDPWWRYPYYYYNYYPWRPPSIRRSRPPSPAPPQREQQFERGLDRSLAPGTAERGPDHGLQRDLQRR